MDDRNAKWLDNKSPINHLFKGFSPTNMLLPQLTFPNPIFGPKVLEETNFPNIKFPFLNVV
jgi:hypothetical protein